VLSEKYWLIERQFTHVLRWHYFRVRRNAGGKDL